MEKHIQEHRLIMAKQLNKSLEELNEIHHIDGNKKINDVHNLIELSRPNHSAPHSQLEQLCFEMVRQNMLLFNRETKEYYINPSLYLNTIETSYGFDDIAIKQQKNICASRLDVNTESEIIRGVFVNSPLIAANMSTVVNAEFCIELYSLGALGVLHRAKPPMEVLDDIEKVAKKCEWVAASIGIEKNQFDLAKEMIRSGCNIITIDIAHGFSDAVLDLAKKIKLFSPNTKIIIGNTTNVEMLYESYKFVDAIKVGIAQGFACETKNTAGCTEKQFSAVFKFKQASKEFGIPIISDGSIREPADFVKAIAAGANSIMAGKIFAACPESAADTEVVGGLPKKVYAGMASRYVQEKWKGGLKKGTCPEGGVRYLDIGESAEKLIERYIGALRSGITYAGANDIISFQKNVKFVKFK